MFDLDLNFLNELQKFEYKKYPYRARCILSILQACEKWQPTDITRNKDLTSALEWQTASMNQLSDKQKYYAMDEEIPRVLAYLPLDSNDAEAYFDAIQCFDFSKDSIQTDRLLENLEQAYLLYRRDPMRSLPFFCYGTK